MRGIKIAAVGIIAGVVACLAGVFIPNGKSLTSDIVDDIKSVGFLFVLWLIGFGIFLLVKLLRKEVTSTNRQKTTVFRKLLPYVAVAVVAILLWTWFGPLLHHTHFNLRWIPSMWSTRGFIADVVAVGAVVLALAYGFRRSPAPATPPVQAVPSSANPAAGNLSAI